MQSKLHTGKLKGLRRILLHLLFWIIIVTYFAWGFGFNLNLKISFLNALLYLPGHMIIVYSLIYFLIPRYLIKKKYTWFFAGFLIALGLCVLYAELAQLAIESNNNVFKGFNMTTGRNILPFIHVAGIAISIDLLNYWYLQQRHTMEALQQKTAAELELLKSQVHPHFLFNTLNNLYSHILERSDKAPEIVLKLSNLLRFMIYESNASAIPLTKEIDLLKEYIALEQLRYGSRLDVSFSIDGNLDNREIAPLLMLPLVENAFKHGASNQLDQCWISLDIHVNAGGLHCKLVNSYEPEPAKAQRENKGIGLQNVRKRLELLYPSKYNFSAIPSNDVFIVTLDLQWEEGNRTVIENKSVKPAHGIEMSFSR
ncbi:MAG TPA: histidine kinase [Puia sp.]|nr:histidine kinase [Puia sp.]